MSHLLGAWSLGGAPIERLLGDAERRAMLSQLPIGALHTFASGSAWIVSGPGQQLEDGAAHLAVEGYLVGGVAGLVPLGALANGLAAKPEGHYVLALAQARLRRLTLLRSLSGGERLYYARHRDLVLFASSVKPLLAHPRLGARFDAARLGEALLTGLTLFGRGTLFEGIEEVLPGQRLTFAGEEVERERHWAGLLEPKEGGARKLAREFRETLGEAVTAAIGSQRPAALTLSGGIDSAAVAALAVEAVGADHVEVFTYEFDDPRHGTETPFAIEVCRRLGVRRHHIFKLSFAEYLRAIPETVWRAEHFVHWSKAWMLPVARHIRAAGFDRFLSGFGVGSHMAYLEDLVWALRWLPRPERTLSFWKLARARRFRWLERLESVHPGLSLPNFRQYYLMLCVLREHGLIEDVARFYPARMRPLVHRAAAEARFEPDDERASLLDTLREQSFDRLVSCVDVTRWEKVMREVGALRISPAHFAACIPYAYMPIRPRPRLWSKARGLRPGKLLLRLAMRDTLPESVLYRKKSWADAIVSQEWQRAGVRWMQRVLPDTGEDYLGLADPECLAAIRYWAPQSPQASVTALAFWHHVFMRSGGGAEPPTWRSLGTARRG